ncbi:MAG: hypothetical protein ACREA4_12865 [Nitrososphaera sp.]
MLPGAVLFDESAGGAIYERKPSYEQRLKGDRGYTALVYSVPEQGISSEAAKQISELARGYAHGCIAIGRNESERLCALVENNGHGLGAFDPMDDSKFERVKGRTIVFKTKGTTDYEKKAIIALSRILQNGV